jgi:hypothetical protein
MNIIAFDKIDYLKTGNERQQHAHLTLEKHEFFSLLGPYDPILVGTVPIGIDTADSDLDIICCCADLPAFEAVLKQNFSSKPHFRVKFRTDTAAAVARFQLDSWQVEVWGQDLPTRQQMGYRHMVVEYELLARFGPDFRQQVRSLKEQGYKTEPAFARVMGLSGDPYEELLHLEAEQLRKLDERFSGSGKL